MNTLDYILLGVILLSALWGFRKGFLETLGGILGIIVATVIAGKFYLLLGSFLGGNNLSNFISFLVIFFIILKIVGLSFWILGKIFQLISIVPFLQSFDRLLGAVLGLLEGILVLTVVMYFLSKYPLNQWLLTQMQSSIITVLLLKASYIFMPLLPEAMKRIKSLI